MMVLISKSIDCWGFVPSELDPCLYFGHGMAVLTCWWLYLLWTRCQEDWCYYCKIEKEVDLTVEHTKGNEIDVFAYLEVEVNINKNTQTRLIDKVLKATAPAYTTPLGTDAEGPRCQLSWDYASVIGILMYLTLDSQPDI